MISNNLFSIFAKPPVRSTKLCVCLLGPFKFVNF
jgi:hypothetical protein